MPQAAESPLTRFVNAIADEDGFAFGSPSLSDDGPWIRVPVRRTHAHVRGYVLADEVPGEISTLDLGRIDRVRIRNDSPRCVFVPPGTLLSAKETASRGTTLGVLVEPQAASEIEVRCVHPSRAIAPNVPLEFAPDVVPGDVRRALISRDQGLVWATVRNFVGSQKEKPGSDDLVNSIATRAKAGRDGTRFPPNSSPLEGQCGLVVLGALGVEAMEIYDSPPSSARSAWDLESWMASRAPRAASLAPSQLVPEGAIQAAKAFLHGLAEQPQRRATAHSWVAADGSFEWTVLAGETIHLLAFREDPWTHHASLAHSGLAHGTVLAGGGSAIERFPRAMTSTATGDGDVATADIVTTDADEETEPPAPMARPHRRKVLTSGWDAATFGSLEEYSRKEFGGDRSAALRFLVRQGLDRRGYLGPHPPPSPRAMSVLPAPDVDSSSPEIPRPAVEARILDYERIATTESFAAWLRLRARSELERLATSLTDTPLRQAAQASLNRLSSAFPEPEAEEIPEPEVIPTAPPVDVRPLLRRAFAASAAGQFADALHLFDDALAAEPENRTALLGRAVALRRSGKSQEALATLDRVLAIEPANAAALLNRGRILQERGELEGALATFERLAGLAPNDWDVWMARGDVLARLGREHDARAAYTEALRRNPDDSSLQARIRTLDRARMPPQSPASRVALPKDVQEGQSYLVKGGPPDLGYRVFRALAVRSVPALLITARDADQVRGEQGLGNVRILELTTEPGGDRIPPTSLDQLTGAIERFLAENRGRAAILLDELSPLVEANGFRDTALFLGRVNEDILLSQAVFLVCVARGELGEKESAILERDLRVLS